MPDSATLTTPSGIGGRHPVGALLVDLERHEVALVHTDQGRPDVQGDLELGLVVHLDQRVEPEVPGQPEACDELGLLEDGDDQEHGVRTHQPGVGDVALRHREVLPQHREVGRCPRHVEVVDAAAEELHVGEHRQARRAARFVGLGQRDRVEAEG